MTSTDLSDGHAIAEAQTRCAVGQPLASHIDGGPQPHRAGDLLHDGHTGPDVDPDIQASPVVVDALTTGHATAGTQAVIAGGQPLRSDHGEDVPQNGTVAADLSAVDHAGLETHMSTVDGTSSTTGQPRRDAHSTTAGGGSSSGQPTTTEAPIPNAEASDGWLELRLWAEMFNDAQEARIEGMNKVGLSYGTPTKHDLAENGKYYSFQNKAAGVDRATYMPYIAALELAEKSCEFALRATFRRIVPAPIRAWQRDEGGIGIKTLARLLGHLGDPAVATPHFWQGTGSDRVLYVSEPHERTLAQLWQYCGHGDPTRRIRKGMTAQELAAGGNPRLKVLVHLIADRAVIEKGRDIKALLAGEQQLGATRHYRAVYEERRLKTLDRLHAAECARCSHAAVGSPWKDAHQHADALRLVGKELLRDLWRVARGERLATDHGHVASQRRSVGGDTSTEEAA